jgi:catechol 2,3-dioxygenase-like lactoylglutathione lyase family enzyme
MFSHVMVGSNDISRSKKFYDALVVAMGGQPAVEDARGRPAYTHNGGRFVVSKPIDGEPASHANGGLQTGAGAVLNVMQPAAGQVSLGTVHIATFPGPGTKNGGIEISRTDYNARPLNASHTYGFRIVRVQNDSWSGQAGQENNTTYVRTRCTQLRRAMRRLPLT